ncbi:MAG: Heat shock protein 60 family co-chaperone GroES, partial [uncultured Blastococcus sp.]
DRRVGDLGQAADQDAARPHPGGAAQGGRRPPLHRRHPDPGDGPGGQAAGVGRGPGHRRVGAAGEGRRPGALLPRGPARGRGARRGSGHPARARRARRRRRAHRGDDRPLPL